MNLSVPVYKIRVIETYLLKVLLDPWIKKNAQKYIQNINYHRQYTVLGNTFQDNIYGTSLLSI